MANPLLSTYSGGENRVTASTLAVFERIGLALVEELLQGATGSGPELTAVTFSNQEVGDGSVPDAVIAGNFRWVFETKTERGAYAREGHSRNQLRSHSKELTGAPETRLFVLTPDAERPAWFDQLDGIDPAVTERILWFSFAQLEHSIREIVDSPRRVVPEQARVLLHELVSMYEAAGLLTQDDTVIVAANTAWGEYQRYGAYVCQANRSFRAGLTHLGFYHSGQIEPLIARIRNQWESVMFTHEEATRLRAGGDEELADLVDQLLGTGERPNGVPHGVILLTLPDHAETVRLPHPVKNDTVTKTGRGWAWTLGQRYTSLGELRRGHTLTSELDRSYLDRRK
ncbi:hypothetical protein [Serinicoccus sp. LYQ131]|uniref:hypothetical protein n=1 Tax=Serinicoccus sp. LYQ131 TaxID=3378797 RepID=UPI003851E596